MNQVKKFLHYIEPILHGRSSTRRRRSYLEISPYADPPPYIEYLSRQKILFHHEMVKQRFLTIPIFSYKHKVVFTISNLAGHASFIALSFSYLESDFLSLRLYAMTGIVMSIIFQYYRPIPLWIPIRWNALFFIINSIMVILLLIEENEALNIPPDEIALMHNVFGNHGYLRAVDFRHLLSLAVKRIVKPGEKLVSQGDEHHHIHLVKSGKLLVQRGHKTIGTIEKYQFVGEMSFLSWENNVDQQLRSIKERDLDFHMWNANALDSKLFQLPWLFDDDIHKYLEELLSSNQSQLSQQKKEWKSKQDKLPKGELGHADVVCVEECEVYTWTFQSLHDLMASQPNVGIVIEKTLAADLNKKMVRSWTEEPKLRYRDVLSGMLADGEITDRKKGLLATYRQDYSISNDDHRRMMNDLGWTQEDYDVGSKGGPSLKSLQAYEKTLTEYLLNQSKISENNKNHLRNLRKQYMISGEIHVRLLMKLGWSFDEYEAGNRSVETHANSVENRIESESINAGLQAISNRPSTSTMPRFHYLSLIWKTFTFNSSTSNDSSLLSMNSRQSIESAPSA